MREKLLLAFGVLVLIGPLPGCAPLQPGAVVARPVAEGPRVRVLGSVQDGGLPHAACACQRCEAARMDPALRRHVACLSVLLPDSRRSFLIDATPDLGDQLQALSDFAPAGASGVDRAPVTGVILTHAHIGHYLGLAFFGFEAVNTRGLPVFCSSTMGEYLRSNGPFSQLVALGNIALEEIRPQEAFELGDGVRVTPLAVPHRHEYSDTLGFVVSGPARSLLYVPDTDSWRQWTVPLREVLAGIDVAILDGTFYSLDELPGRDIAAIGHPLITETMQLLESLVREGRVEVHFTHLNHSNPALDAGSTQRAEIERRGFHVLEEGREFPL